MKRQANVLSALIQNFDTAEKAIEASADSAGSALRENEVYLDSIQGKIDQFTAALQSMWKNTLDSDVVKGFVNLGTEIIKIVDAIGLLNSTLLAFGAYKGFKSLFGAFKSGGLTLKVLTKALWSYITGVETVKSVNIKQIFTEKILRAEWIKNLALAELKEAQDKKLAAAKQHLEFVTMRYKIGVGTAAQVEAAESAVKAASIPVDITKIKTTDLLSLAYKKLKKNILATLKVLAPLAVAVVAIVGVTHVVDALTNTTEELQEKYDELNNTLSETESKLSDLESQLSDVNNQIKEINSQDSLSFTDQEELNRLKEQRAELQRQVDLYNKLKEQQQIDMNESALNMANNYANVGKTTGKTTAELAEGSGKGAAIVGGIGGGILGGVKLGAAFGPWGIAIGAAVGAIAGGIIGALGGAAVGELEPKVGDSLDNIKEQHEKLQKDFNEARDKYTNDPSKNNKKKFEEAQEALQDYEAATADYLSKMDSYYGQIDWKTATTEQKKAMQEFYDKQDEWAISSGSANAKSNALNRIFGENAEGGFAKARDEIDKIKEKLKEAQESGDELAIAEALSELENFKLDGVLSEEEIARLRNIGIYLYEAENNFKDVVKTESEFIDNDLEGVAKDINKIADGLGSLKSAFEEVVDEGVLMAATVIKFRDELKIDDYANNEEVTNAWREYLDVMMSGAATTEEMTAATEGLAQAIIEAALASNDLMPDTKWDYIAQLQALGVENAQEYVEDLLQKNMVKDIEAKLAAGTLDDEAIRNMAEAYGVEESAIEEIIKKLKEKKKLEEDKKSVQAQKDAYNEWLNNSKTGINAVKEKMEAAQKAVGNFNPAEWRIQRNGQYINTKTYKTMSSVEMNELREKYNEYVKLKQEYDALWQEGIDKGYIIDGKIVNPDFEGQLNELTTEINGIDEEIDKELTVEVQLELDLQNKNDLVDDIQNVFDTLVDAQKEYEENGYLSVDTLQNLLKLEPKYLDLLVDEEGNLNLTKDALYNVARARIIDMGVQAQKNILESATKLATEGSSEALREEISVMEDASEAGTDFVSVQMAKVKAILAERVAAGELTQDEADAFVEGTMNQIEAVQVATQSALDNLSNSLSSSGNTETGEIEDAFQKAMDYWDNRIEANQAKYDQIQNDIDWLESQGKMADANYYKDQISLMTEGEESKTALLNNKLAQAAARMRELEAAGQEGSDEWWEAASIYNDTLSELDDVRDTVIELQDAIGEVEWSQFEEFNTRLDDINSKLETMRDLIAPDGEEDWFDDEGNWTEKGVAVLGSYIQSLEYYKNGLAETNKELADFQSKGAYSEENAQWFADNYGIHSEQEYYDYLKGLTDEQYNYATAVSDTEQDIIGMYESSIDAVEEYTSELIDSYNDYIDVVKEALDAERDLYNFKKDVKKQTKDIANLERRIASLSGSTNAADIAERRKLEAELYDSRENLNDTYYEHSMDSRQEALDQEAQAYEEAMNKFVENLRTNLDLALQDMDSFMAGVTAAVTANAPLILDEYNKLGISLDSAIVDPWQAAADAMDGYTKEDGLGLMNSWTASGGVFDTFANNATTYLTSIWDDENVDPNDAFENAIVSKVGSIKESIRKNVEESKGYLTDLYNVKDTSVGAPPKVNGPVYDPSDGVSMSTQDVKRLQEVLNTVFGTKLSIDGSYGPATIAAVKKAQGIMGIGQDGYYGPNTESAMRDYIKNKWQANNKGWSYIGQAIQKYLAMLPTSYYAKGTLGTSRDEWALTDEIGDELVLVPGANGNLSFMRKGTSVVPADITANLVEWGKLNPNMLNVGGGANINMISNAVTKPELNFSFDSLVHVDHCDEGTLKDLEKMIDNKINQFSKQMNYAIKRIGGR